jgi:hypothetical protein
VGQEAFELTRRNGGRVALSNKEIDEFIDTIDATFPPGAIREEIWEVAEN